MKVTLGAADDLEAGSGRAHGHQNGGRAESTRLPDGIVLAFSEKGGVRAHTAIYDR